MTVKKKRYQKKWARVVFRRRFFVISVLLVQLCFILILAAGSSRTFLYVNYFLNAVSIGVCFYIINRKKKAGYKLIWIFLIMMFPIFGGLVYVIFHSQANSRRLKALIDESDRNYRHLFFLPGDILPDLKERHRDYLAHVYYLQEFAGFPVYARTLTEYLPSGEAFFEKVLPELEKAEKYIFLEFFILRQGVMLDPIIAILEKKARAGVDVRIIYDDLGCFMSLPSNYKEHLERNHIKCMVFNPFKPILSSLQNNRDHRKIVSIDGKTAFTGGFNLADEYINAQERFGHWRDAGVMLKGQAAWSLTLIFLKMWHLGESVPPEETLSFYPWLNSPCDIPSDGYIQPYADSPIDEENVGEHVYIQIINRAKDYVYICTPYLVVDDNLLSALTLAAKSGIDVRIITPHHWDKKIVQITSRSYYRHLILAGVKIYEYTEGFNHSKTFVSDDKTATVGTTNLDFRSLYLHFECGVWIYDSEAVGAIKEDFLNTLTHCREFTLRDCAANAFEQITQDVLRVFAPLM